MTVIVCAGLMTAVTLGAAPLAVLPLAIAISIGCPMAMTWPLPRALAVLRASRSATEMEEQALRSLRRRLARLPETEHPLGL